MCEIKTAKSLAKPNWHKSAKSVQKSHALEFYSTFLTLDSRTSRNDFPKLTICQQ